MAAIVTAAHAADVVAGPAPAAVAAGAGLAVVVARSADAVAVLVAGDADVPARPADAAVAPRAFGVAGVGLAVADELVGAAAEVDGQWQRQALLDPHEVAVRSHVDFDSPGGAAQVADGEPVGPLESAARRMLVRHVPAHDQVPALHAQAQGRAGCGSMHDDAVLRHGDAAGKRQRERDSQRKQGCSPSQDHEQPRTLR